jgi:RAT1-interacting protein
LEVLLNTRRFQSQRLDWSERPVDIMADIQIPLSTIHNPRNAPIPAYQAPHLIATYSHLADRTIVHNDASMAYYKGASAGDDLKAGYENFIERDPFLEEHLDGVCASLLKFRREGGQMKDHAIITFRGQLTR